MSTLTIPSVAELLSSLSPENTRPLTDALSLLFEPSPVLEQELVPQLAEELIASPPDKLPKSYEELINRAIDAVHGWDKEQQGTFVKGHPRIGEVKKELSVLSAKEQGSATDPVVIEKLRYLNDVFERRYPGLVYITFVNGRSRATIVDEMEERLISEGVLVSGDDRPSLDDIHGHDVHSEAWNAEVTRAVSDVGKIAVSRMKKLGAI